MSIKINHELPVPEVLKNEYPLSNEQKSIKQQRDEEIRRIFTGESDKFVVLVGPCSADNEDTVCEYVNRLKKIKEINALNCHSATLDQSRAFSLISSSRFFLRSYNF